MDQNAEVHYQPMQCPKCGAYGSPLRDGETYRSPCCGLEIQMLTRRAVRAFRRELLEEEAMHGGSP